MEEIQWQPPSSVRLDPVIQYCVVIRLQRHKEWVEILHASVDTCTTSDSSTNAFTNGCTDSFADTRADSFADSFADFFADSFAADARFCEYVGCHFRPVHARRRMCAEPELSAVLQQQPEVHD